ncbi:MAG: nickel pincer cofactor biosynthesis protein LarC [Acidobacteria bacterium]|jgi:uncharacterized protein (TIGR00299 family) protein|nr:MAG: nickel pincer cofactor biosynthesis protein LarC [Acidobacteriota bacterium]GIU81517.1 MAG: UPF0272 protein [Pyrinomonadaceae bacterium]
MKVLYFDCFAGASGNMILGALVGLGVNADELIEKLRLMKIPDFQIEFSEQDKSGIKAIYAEVKAPDEKHHRHLSEIERIISESSLSAQVKDRACRIFRKIAEAEAKIHGVAIEKIHFHEVGAMDSILDIVGACVGFEILGIQKFICSPINTGHGFVQMQHGQFPIPAPAVTEILQGIPIYSNEIEGELITPTGAAIIATLCSEFGTMPKMKIEKVAYGAGKRDYQNFPNVLRLLLGEEIESPNEETYTSKTFQNAEDSPNHKTTETLILLETNVDDVSPEVLGFLMEKAFQLGALDCWFTPIQMKKSRPGVMISVLCEKGKENEFAKLLYNETSTLGIRFYETKRQSLRRQIVSFQSKYGSVNLKISHLDDEIISIKPEYEQIREIALKLNKPFRQIEREILKELKDEQAGSRKES